MRRRLTARLAIALALVTIIAGAPGAGAQSYQRISGEGSSWAANAIDAMRVNVKQFGITVDYSASGSTTGRRRFLDGIIDFAASDIPFQFRPEDGSAPENPAPGSYAYMPITAGGTAFMYNLRINGQRVTNLRLSGENVARIFTGGITQWNDPAIAADNPGLTLPNRKVVPVVRSDGSGSTAQFTMWMINQHGALWNDYCRRSNRAPACGVTSYYPTVAGMIAQNGDLGVAGYVSQSFAEGSIGYVNYSYALGTQFPVAKVLNRAGYYTEPTPENVAVSLLKARINQDPNSQDYLTQVLDDVYVDTDPRNYQLSSYSYLILPTKVQGQFNEAKGKTLGAFSYYAMCQAQQQSASLGYSPMPVNLVEASFDQIRKIPGVVVQDINIRSCKNPTFSESGENLLAQNAPQPQPCDKRGPAQCSTGTGGQKKTATTVMPSAAGGTAGDSQPQTAAAVASRATTGAAPGAGGAAAGGAAAATATVDSGTDAGALVDPSRAAAAGMACDPETGACASPDALVAAAGGLGAEQAFATPTVLAGTSGWSGPQWLMLLVGLLLVALIVAPALVWRALADQGTRR